MELIIYLKKMITRGELRRKIYLKATALGKNIQCYLTKRNTNSKVYYYVEPQTKPDDYRHIIEKQGQIVTQILDKLQKRNLDEHTFYTLLWEQICNDTLFPSDEEKIAVLVQLFNMPTLPYFQMEASHKMEDAEYSRWTDELLPKIQKAVYALNCGFEQKTQVTEQLLIIEKTITDDKAKQVFWSHIISFFERKIEQKTCRKKDINDEQKDG